METTISVRLYFKFRGHQCKEVFYAESALYLLRNSIKPKVVLTHITLPDMSGYDMCKIIKSDPDLKNIPVIFLTARPASEVEKRLEETKADGYILKPFKPNDFDRVFKFYHKELRVRTVKKKRKKKRNN